MSGKADDVDFPATAEQLDLCKLFSEAYHSYHEENLSEAIKQFRFTIV